MGRLSNPIAFTPRPVTVLTSLIYVALLVSLIVVHTTVPSAPRSATPIKGINITEAYRDLKLLTRFYHPYNSHANDDVRQYLLGRIEEILESNHANRSYSNQSINASATSSTSEESQVYIFDDLSSNITSSNSILSAMGQVIWLYFEGTNIIVYIRGTEDDQSNWWEGKRKSPNGPGGVMVNAHYDSVSTGFGATDDGVGVVSVLQIIKYYSTPGNTPKRGIVALLNNGEEDGLYGARAFGAHPLSKFPHTFLNLEGAGAGGRALMFRATDAEVVEAYRNSPHPFSTVASNDGFEVGAVKSQTDFVIFNGIYGMRGLDLAFMEPRARYHTEDDDTRHSGMDSLWHMLSSAIATTKALTSDTSGSFDGKSGAQGKVPSGSGSKGVWFDMFGSALAVARLHTFFALSVTLLVVTPVFLLITSLILHKVDRYYLFSGSRLYHVADGDEEIKLYGWRGFFRFPVIFIISAATPIALAFLLTKQNPFIIHSSQWSVWAMMFSSFFFVAWFCCCAAYFTRPSALTKTYGYIWLTVLFWAILVANTVFENQMHLAAGYFFVLYFAALSFVTWLSHLELFALPRKSKYCHTKMDDYGSVANSQILAPDRDERVSDDDHDGEEDEATESTSLLRNSRRQTFANYSRNEDDEDATLPTPTTTNEKTDDAFSNEQEWSSSLPRWTWLLQVIILVPVAVIFSVQTGFLLVSATHQLGEDGTSALLPYIIEAVFTILTLLPLLPIFHRFTWHIPSFLLHVFIGTLIYNLVAFPFSEINRLKLSFQQTIDLDTGVNNVTLQGPQPYLLEAISSLPSSAGQSPSCTTVPQRESLEKCSWHGLAPAVIPYDSLPETWTSTAPSLEQQYQSWLTYNITSPSPSNPSNTASARFALGGKNTRACKILFDPGNLPAKFSVLDSGAATDNDRRIGPTPEGGSHEIRLWSRTWDRTWVVDVEWDEEDSYESKSKVGGQVVCMWSDVNQIGAVPALDEVRHFAPRWTSVSKMSDGLVEGYKRFEI